jgi:hypothetical protein
MELLAIMLLIVLLFTLATMRLWRYLRDDQADLVYFEYAGGTIHIHFREILGEDLSRRALCGETRTDLVRRIEPDAKTSGRWCSECMRRGARIKGH